MPTFKIQLNGKKVCKAGLAGEGVIGVHVSWFRRKRARRAQKLSLHVGGFNSSTGEHLVWREALPVRVGDEVRIKVVKTAPADKPSTCKKPDAAAGLRARKRYVRDMAKQLGWKIVMPK